MFQRIPASQQVIKTRMCVCVWRACVRVWIHDYVFYESSSRLAEGFPHQSLRLQGAAGPTHTRERETR